MNKGFTRFAIVLAAAISGAVVGARPLAALNTGGAAVIDRVVGIFSMWTGEDPNKALFDQAARYIDYSEMAERSLGGQWSQLSEVDRREFVYVFRRLVEERYYKRWHKIFAKGRMKFIEEAPTRGGLFVKTRLALGKDDDELVWQLSKRSGQYKVVSIAVDEKDLLTRISLRLQKHLRNDGFDNLLAWMKDEADLDDEDDGVSRMKSTASR